MNFDILQLNDMIVPELLDIAKKLDIKDAAGTDKQALIYKILDAQAVLPSVKMKKGPAPKPAKEESADKPTKAKKVPAKKADAKVSAPAEAIIEKYDRYWMDIIGTRGFKGKKAKSGRPMFNALFETVDETDEDSVQLDEDFSPDQQARLDQLQHEQVL